MLEECDVDVGHAPSDAPHLDADLGWPHRRRVDETRCHRRDVQVRRAFLARAGQRGTRHQALEVAAVGCPTTVNAGERWAENRPLPSGSTDAALSSERPSLAGLMGQHYPALRSNNQ